MIEIKIKFFKPRVLASIRRIGRYQDSVPDAWEAMLNWLDGFGPDDMPTKGYGLNYDDPRTKNHDTLRYAAAIEMPKYWEPDDTSPVDSLFFEGGVYALKSHVGSYLSLSTAVSKFRDEWVPKSGLVLDRNRPILTRYKSDPRKVSHQDQRADVCLPVFADRRSQDRGPTNRTF